MPRPFRPRHASATMLSRAPALDAAAVRAGTAGALLALAGSLAGVALPRVTLAHEDVDERIVRVSARLAEAPESARLWFERGALHRERGHWDGALRDFRRAAALPGNRARADAQIARVHSMRGAHALALRHAERALGARTDDLLALRLRAEARHALGDHRGAANDFRRVIDAVSATPVELFLARARAIAARGEDHVDAAVVSLREGLAHLGPAPQLEREIVDLYRRSGRLAEALVALRKIIDARSRPERWYALRGDLLVEHGYHAAARRSYRAAIDAIDALPAARADVPAMRALRGTLSARLELDR